MILPPVVEFRQYRLQPGMRETLISLFEREFVETQEACCMSVLGHFRDLDDPDRFTWLRGFASMAGRPDALDAFYNGAVWAAHRDAANDTMIDSDDVHLLATREARADPSTEAGTAVLATILRSGGEAAETGRPLGAFRTLNEENNWPRLPVNENDPVTLRLSGFASVAAMDAARDGLAARFSGGKTRIEFRRLTPTRRSRLR